MMNQEVRCPPIVPDQGYPKEKSNSLSENEDKPLFEDKSLFDVDFSGNFEGNHDNGLGFWEI